MPNDHKKAMKIAEQTALMLQTESSLDDIMGEFDRLGLCFKNNKEIRDFMPTIIDLAYNVRIWSINGHKPSEIPGFIRDGLGEFSERGRPHFSVIQGGLSKKASPNDS